MLTSCISDAQACKSCIKSIKSNRLARVLRCVKLQKLLCIDKTSEKTIKGVLAGMQRQFIRNATSWCNHFRLLWLHRLQLSSSIQLERYIRVSDANIPQQILKSLVARAVAPRVAGFGEISWLDRKVHRCWNHPINGAFFLSGKMMLKMFRKFEAIQTHRWKITLPQLHKSFNQIPASEWEPSRHEAADYAQCICFAFCIPEHGFPIWLAVSIVPIYNIRIYIYIYTHTYCTVYQFVNGCHQSQVGLNV